MDAMGIASTSPWQELHGSIAWGWPDAVERREGFWPNDLDLEVDLLAYPLAQRLSALAFPEGT